MVDIIQWVLIGLLIAGLLIQRLAINMLIDAVDNLALSHATMQRTLAIMLGEPVEEDDGMRTPRS